MIIGKTLLCPQIDFRFSNDSEIIKFPLEEGRKKTNPEDFWTEKLTGLRLIGTGEESQRNGVAQIKDAFGQDPFWQRVQSVDQLRILKSDTYYLLGYDPGEDSIELDDRPIDLVQSSGVIGCWDNASFWIAISQEYGILFAKILKELFVPGKLVIGTNTSNGKTNLLFIEREEQNYPVIGELE